MNYPFPWIFLGPQWLLDIILQGSRINSSKMSLQTILEDGHKILSKIHFEIPRAPPIWTPQDQNTLFQQFQLSNLGWGPWWSPIMKEIGIWTLNFRENNFFKNPLDWISCGKRRRHLAFSKFFSRLGLKKKNINLWVETYNVWLWDLILGPQLSNSSKLFVCVCVCPQKCCL